jgi:hypothetical protein
LRRTRVLAASVAAVAATGIALAVPHGAQADTAKQSAVTTVGVHNTYTKDAYAYLAQALDAGTSMIELDVWVDITSGQFKVSHDNPLGNDNNCVVATDPSQLYTGGRDRNLENCLDDVRVWYDAHPGHAPLTIKIEMKAGFEDNDGLGPDELDALIKAHLGSKVFKPADLKGSYPSLDAAAQADNWPTRDALAGKVMFEIIPGTVEQNNPFDDYWTDEEEATYLKNLNAAGHFANGQVFPSVLKASTGDPRTRYDSSLRPYFVFFDGDAATFVSSVDTSFYRTHHYQLIMTDAQNVPPAISATTPTVAQATARVQQLAADNASIVSSDWRTLTTVLPMVLPRG